VRLLRKMGDIEKLRQAREAMSELFPLTPALWQEWSKDEASLGTGYHSFHFYFPLVITFAYWSFSLVPWFCLYEKK
jgi:hypothetical protein